MNPTTLTFGLLDLLTGSWAQHSVTQEPSMTVTPGKTARISLTLGGGLTVSGNRIAFHQQKLGKVPRYLLYYITESNKGKGEGVEDRFVGSGSCSVGYLTINGVQEKDDAVYYCSSWTGSQCTVTQDRGSETEPAPPPQLWGGVTGSGSQVQHCTTRLRVP
ncbi:hypothetical protein NDU88_006771 [Pleurodeles waltl]|uniref:Immunoglobulin V-set domain-containing protein n=1 Tax=Pleurodeles waltl TaxID=8319 RepID=A0AAV7LXV4_PLEWA|nr:hypothetical protein NDU88_006771 [Pleurodeles waltl]